MRKICLLMAILVLLSACALFKRRQIPAPQRSVPWQDTDSRQAATGMVERMLSSGWYQDFVGLRGRTPVFALGVVQITAADGFPQASLAKAMENALIAANIRLVAGREDGSAGLSFPDPVNEMDLARASGADFLLSTAVSISPQSDSGSHSPRYSITFGLTDADKARPVWTDTRLYEPSQSPTE